jgi:uncharacterized sulfatase
MAKATAGSHNETSLLAAFDLVPSLLSMAQVDVPEGIQLDGQNVAPVLLGQSTGSRSQPLFWRRPPDRKTVNEQLTERLPDLAMRDGDWKLLCEYDGTLPQLYDLSKDDGETTNLADQKADKVAAMTKALLQWHLSMPPDHGPTLGQVPTRKRPNKPTTNR